MDIDYERAASPSAPMQAYASSSQRFGSGRSGHSGSSSESGAPPSYADAWGSARSARGKRRRSVSPTSGHEARDGATSVSGLSAHRPFVRARTHTPTLPDAYPAHGSASALPPHYSQMAGGSRIDAVWSAPPQAVTFGDAAMDECGDEARRDVRLGLDEAASPFSRWTLPRVRQAGAWGAFFDAERLDGRGMTPAEAAEQAMALAPDQMGADDAMRDDDHEMDFSPPMPPFQRWTDQALPPRAGSSSHAVLAPAAHVPSRPSPLGFGLSRSGSMRQSMPSSSDPANMRRRVSSSFEPPPSPGRAMHRAGSWGRASPQPPSSAPLPAAWRHPFSAASAWPAEGGAATASLDRTAAHAQLVGGDAAQGMAGPSTAEQTLRAGMLAHPRWRHLAPQHLSPD